MHKLERVFSCQRLLQGCFGGRWPCRFATGATQQFPCVTVDHQGQADPAVPATPRRHRSVDQRSFGCLAGGQCLNPRAVTNSTLSHLPALQL